MATLTVSEFSCIKDATLNLSQLTILIGPQASGKSVLSKLVYFCNSIIVRRFIHLRQRSTLAELQSDLAQDFKKWFPSSAWGKSAFTIAYTAGRFEVRISRKKTRKGLSDEVNIRFSDPFAELYEKVLAQVQKEIAALRLKQPDEQATFREWEVLWRLEQETSEAFRKLMERDFLAAQSFVPAGRSFFTSIGKAIVAFEQGGMLDPLTVQFGRTFTSLRDRDTVFVSPNEPMSSRNAREELMKKLFGGEIRYERDREYVISDDGRKIPFSALSSGQQELLPLWTVLNLVAANSDHLIYIEEPEAHLFPSAQNTLIEYLSGLVGGARRKRMLITTHSPYVLAKINNLLKAGELAGRSPKTMLPKLGSIVRKEFQLAPGSAAAFAIKDGVLHPILDDDLIDGEYLDEVSGDIAKEFSALLEFESTLT